MLRGGAPRAISGRRSSGPEMPPELHRMSLLRPFSAALQGGAPRAIVRQAQQQPGNCLRMAQDECSEAMFGRPSDDFQAGAAVPPGRFSDRRSSGPEMTSEWHRMSVLRPCSAALRGGAPRAIFRQAQQRCGNSLRMARISVLRHFSAALRGGAPRAIFRQAQQRSGNALRMAQDECSEALFGRPAGRPLLRASGRRPLFRPRRDARSVYNSS